MFWKSVTIVGFPYKSCSWVMMSLINMVKFHHVRVRVLDNLNRALLFVSNIWKHALVMFFYERK